MAESSRPRGLGRGLAALVAEFPTGATSMVELEIGQVRPNPRQPRRVFDDEAIQRLSESVKADGIVQPIVVRDVGDGYEIVAGERRWRAARRLGIGRMPALVRDSDDVAALEQALVENVHRADLNALEEAAAYQQLIEDFSLTHEAVATRVGRSRTAVTNTLRLLQLPPSVQRHVRDGALSMGHARALLGTPDRSLQEALASQAVREGWSVRAIEQAVRAPATPSAKSGSGVDPSGATKALRPPGLAELEGLLGDHLDTRVAISMGARRGKITIEFSDLEDLERIYKTIAG